MYKRQTQNYFLPLIDTATGLPKPAYMQPDATHPNAQGVALILDALGPQVLQLLAQLPH